MSSTSKPCENYEECMRREYDKRLKNDRYDIEKRSLVYIRDLILKRCPKCKKRPKGGK